ncbi:uncharacterized protein LOC109823662 isoform X2 [Asparagus officinalis]|uniref:uncharacterized protein LOC109823662 isoform X2 n=1 Tax=Asparagus officinalis TaxID=4686 RepID=UPI00098DFD9F|nr:uncharacterized protein LOC109823662 isoform X2 [Asparagus officinalis]
MRSNEHGSRESGRRWDTDGLDGVPLRLVEGDRPRCEELVAKDRMPVILRDTGSIDLWLNDSMAKHETVLGPCEDLDLVWYPVTPAMGKPSFDGPECSKEIQLKASGEKPLSTFFTKKSEVKCEPEPELLKSSKQEHDPCNLKEEPGSDDVEQKVTDEEEDNKKPEISCVKRGLEEMENPSQPKHENLQRNQTSPVKKKVKSVKNTDDKQSSLLSYFGRS